MGRVRVHQCQANCSGRARGNVLRHCVVCSPSSIYNSQLFPNRTQSSVSALSTSMSHSSSSANSKAKIEAAVEDAAVSSASSAASSGTIDLSGLTRNTYIIMGMLGGALVLLIGVVAKLFAGSRNNTGYRAVPNPTVRPPVHFEKPYEPDSQAFQTRYDGGGEWALCLDNVTDRGVITQSTSCWPENSFAKDAQLQLRAYSILLCLTYTIHAYFIH
ncbi:hypothetical protein AcV5_008599 [Taiwanofungus camphoratus]|nr:hypothetical protein AcV5_008599 [Antrodia cinnamomea]